MNLFEFWNVFADSHVENQLEVLALYQQEIGLGILSYLFGYPKLDISPPHRTYQAFFGRKYVMLWTPFTIHVRIKGGKGKSPQRKQLLHVADLFLFQQILLGRVRLCLLGKFAREVRPDTIKASRLYQGCYRRIKTLPVWGELSSTVARNASSPADEITSSPYLLRSHSQAALLLRSPLRTPRKPRRHISDV